MKNKNLVVIQLSGGNDYLNTIVPYECGLYYDYRPNMGLKDDSIIPVDDKVALIQIWMFLRKVLMKKSGCNDGNWVSRTK